MQDGRAVGLVQAFSAGIILRKDAVMMIAKKYVAVYGLCSFVRTGTVCYAVSYVLPFFPMAVDSYSSRRLWRALAVALISEQKSKKITTSIHPIFKESAFPRLQPKNPP